MSSSEKYRIRLVNLLKELFQLDQPELDFGLYKIMHAKSVQLTRFLENDLLKEIEQAFGDKDIVDVHALKAQAQAKLKEALGDEALDESGQLNEIYTKTPAGKKYLEEMAAAEAAKDTLNAEAEVYDHLYRFFERYYDSGDFMSRRYYARESDSRAAPYAVPYDGREVYLHWANKDQYYIKSSEYLSNFTFELNEAIRQEVERQKGAKSKIEEFDFGEAISDKPLKVHLRIVDASEGEHGNIKASSDQKRFFIIDSHEPVRLENGELVIQFQYRVDAEKSGQDNTWQQNRLAQAEEIIVKALAQLDNAGVFARSFQLPAPTDSQKQRTLLGKYLQKYADRNTMDYFIHKDLGGFLRRELDFYIKNEIMRLDDIENAEAPKVEQYLSKIRVLRRIAQQLIAFLAQLENFQKRLWLKKKFVAETQYCVTLDRIPECLYSEIANNDAQREEWIKLFAIDEIESDLTKPNYSVPLTVEFLKANPFLLIDTRFFTEDFKGRLLNEIQGLDKQSDGLLIHSENFQALSLVQNKYKESVNYIYIDPPYNTASTPILYKNEYKRSSWASLMLSRLDISKKLLTEDGVKTVAIDDAEMVNLSKVLEETYGEYRQTKVTVVHNPKGSITRDFNRVHEYAIFLTPPVEKKVIARSLEENGSPRKMRRWGENSLRTERKLSFYPIYVKGKKVVRVGTVPDDEFHPKSKNVVMGNGEIEVWPIDQNGIERRWNFGLDSIHENLDRVVVLEDEGIVDLFVSHEMTVPKTVWAGGDYDAGNYGNTLLIDILGSKKFDFPKSINLVQKCVYLATSENKDALVLDYFGGSGTTAHAVIRLNSEDSGQRKFCLVEMGKHFDTVVLPRTKKVIYSKDWKDGKPISREGVSHFVKYIRLESYEDALNNLVLKQDETRDAGMAKNATMRRDYLLNYFLEVETEGSQSLLNITDFRDPTAYKMRIKKPGSEEQILQSIDLIETFNWLIGLWVEHMAAPQAFNAEFVREQDPDLPGDQNTRLLCKHLKTDSKGDYWFRLIEGYTLKTPGDKSSKVSTLVIWRKQTDDAEKDNAVLQAYLERVGISTREKVYEVIYVNGSHTLPNPVVEGEQTKVRLIEEAFHRAMWTEEAN